MIHIVTDSAAQFTRPDHIQGHPITILPNRLQIGGDTYREGEDIAHEEALRLIAQQKTAPRVLAPSSEDYAALYARLARSHDKIISIHASREIYSNWTNASAAAQQMDNVYVVDSRLAGVGLGMIVQVAMAEIEAGKAPDDVVRCVRGAVDRVFAVYYAETMDYLHQNHIMSPSHTVLGAMLGVKPFLTIDEGRFVPSEKMKTRQQAIERLVEFTAEFTDIEDVMILQHQQNITEQTSALRERLAVEFPDQVFPYMMYAPSLAAIIGADATGIVILEKEIDDHDI